MKTLRKGVGTRGLLAPAFAFMYGHIQNFLESSQRL